MKKTYVVGLLSSVIVAGILADPDVVSAENISYTLEPIAQELENDAIEKYNALLYEWAYDKDRIDDVHADFPDYYGGAYINDKQQLVIQVTELSDAVETELSDIISLDNVVFEEVTYSYTTLVSEKEELIDAWQTDEAIASADEVTAIGVDIKDNAVAVYIDSSQKSRLYVQTVKDCKEAINFENIKPVYGSGKGELASALYPGGEINGDRSIGFWAKNSNGNLGIVTASHLSIIMGDEVNVGGTTFGYAEKFSFGDSVDAVFVRLTNSNFTPSRFVQGHGFSLVSSSYVSLPVGATVYSRGNTSKNKTGTVLDINYSCTLSGYSFTNVVKASNSVDGGDSGGIVAGAGNSSIRNVAGIITGEKDGCLIYTKVLEIKSELGITVY